MDVLATKNYRRRAKCYRAVIACRPLSNRWPIIGRQISQCSALEFVMYRLIAGGRRAVVYLLSAAMLLALVPTRAAAQPMTAAAAALLEGYDAKILAPTWRAVFPARGVWQPLFSGARLRAD